jgi:hypothetical protein
MNKVIGLIVFTLVAGCSSKPYDTTMYNLHKVKGQEVICKQEADAIHMVKMGFSASAKYQQGLILANASKQGKCRLVEEASVVKTGDSVIFPITDEFPESFRGIKKVVFRVHHNGEIYWLVPTGNQY